VSAQHAFGTRINTNENALFLGFWLDSGKWLREIDHFEHGANAAVPGGGSSFHLSFGGHILSVLRKGWPFQAN
jgi:hypothetical protein